MRYVFNLNLNTAKKFIKFWILILDYGSEGKFCLNFVHSNYSLGVRLGLNGEGGDGVNPENPDCRDLPRIVRILETAIGFSKLLIWILKLVIGIANLTMNRDFAYRDLQNVGILLIGIYEMSGLLGFCSLKINKWGRKQSPADVSHASNISN